MAEESIDIESNLGTELAGKLRGMNKPELLNRLTVSIMRGRVHQETISDLEGQIKKMKKDSRGEIDNLCEYNTQAQVMIEAIMERWNDYST